MSTSVMQSSRFTKQRSAGSLRPDAGRMLNESASVLRFMFDAPPVGRMRFRVSRGRNGDVSNPVYVMAETFVAHRDAGGTEPEARRALAYLESVVASLHGECPRPLREVMLAEQEVDGREDYLQLRAAMDDAAKAAYADVLEESIAMQSALLRKLRSELHARGAA